MQNLLSNSTTLRTKRTLIGKIVDINELKNMLGQLFGMSIVDSEISITKNQQYYNHSMGLLQHTGLVHTDITIKGICKENKAMPVDLQPLLRSMTVTKTSFEEMKQEYAFTCMGDSEDFLTLIKDIHKKEYDRVFIKKMKEIINE